MKFNPLSSKLFDFVNNSFDFLRLIMAVLIVVGHSGGVGGFGWEPNIKMRDWKMTGTNLATFSVYGFFVISGFLVTRSWFGTSDWKDFCVKRLRRIYPGYFVSLVISGLFFVPIFYFLTKGFYPIEFIKDFGRETSQYIISNLFVEIRQPGITGLTSDLRGGYLGVNGPHWSLIHEMRAYLMIIVLGLLGWLQKSRLILILAVFFNFIYAVCALDYVYYYGNSSFHFRDLVSTFLADYHLFILFTYFIFGMAFYIFREKIVWNKWIYMLSILGLIVGWKLDIFALYAPMCFTYFILYSSQIFPFQNLSKKIGDLSYGIYIYSWPIQLCLLYLGLNKLTGNKFYDYLIYAGVSIILSGFAGYLSWNFVEKKWIARKN
jgi:peptidoglycan/LPS O-acetylase OafA/YrhL